MGRTGPAFPATDCWCGTARSPSTCSRSRSGYGPCSPIGRNGSVNCSCLSVSCLRVTIALLPASPPRQIRIGKIDHDITQARHRRPGRELPAPQGVGVDRAGRARYRLHPHPGRSRPSSGAGRSPGAGNGDCRAGGPDGRVRRGGPGGLARPEANHSTRGSHRPDDRDGAGTRLPGAAGIWASTSTWKL